MNKYLGTVRSRNQTLLVVEGHHERNILFWLMFKCFPEISIDLDNVWIYGTNIYVLYEDIVKEYGSDWAEEEMDIDLPFVISKKQTPDALKYKADFTNIILVFDYERHDTYFSERKILEMQNAFSDSTDMGKLYINYPMIESYQHLNSIPDSDYAERKVPVSFEPGSKYKELVRKESYIKKIVEFPYRMDDLMSERFGITNAETRRKCCDDILNFSDTENVEDKLHEVLKNAITDHTQKTLVYQLKDWINKVGYVNSGQTYWQYARNMFVEIIYHNICKANRIVNNKYDIELDQSKDCFENLDLGEILRIQNTISNTSSGFIWVLNTCVFVVADYNFSLVQKEKKEEL